MLQCGGPARIAEDMVAAWGLRVISKLRQRCPPFDKIDLPNDATHWPSSAVLSTNPSGAIPTRYAGGCHVLQRGPNLDY
jgi:hypothetical protein